MMLTVWRILIITSLVHSILACGVCELQNAQPRKEDSGMDGLCPQYNSLSPKLLPDKRDCSLFYECSNGKAVIKRCPGNLHFNSDSLVCDYPENAGCQTGTLPKKGDKSGNIKDVVSCPSENSRNGPAISHPTDCSKFFICHQGKPYPQSCPSGLHFNPASGACDYPKNVECGGEGISPKPKGKIPDDNSDNSGCPSGSSGQPMPHPSDCGKYFMCDGGRPRSMSCPYGLDFNPNTQKCDYPENAGCRTGIPPKPTEEVPDDDSGCPSGSVMPHPTDCGKYFMCDAGKPRSMSCPYGLDFNPNSQKCDYPENAGCRTIVPDPPPRGKDNEVPSGNCPPSKSGPMPHPNKCNKFIMCDGGKAYPRSCPAGLHYNPKVKGCDYPENVNCSKQDVPAAPGVPSPYCPSVNGPVPIFYTHPSNCSIYYMCSNGLAYEFKCPAKLHFNLRRKICDYEWLANCRAGNV